MIERVRTTCLPFVTRSLRGSRFRRTWLLSALLGVVSVVVGSWLALGDGRFERDVRQGFDLEVSTWERSRTEFVIIVHDRFEHRRALADRERALRHGPAAVESWGPVHNTMRDAAATLMAATSVMPPPEHAELHARASMLLDSRGRSIVEHDGYRRGFSWHETRDLAQLHAIVDHDLVPRVELYRSPLGVAGAVEMIGLFSGGTLLLLLLVVAPLMAGIQVAQEVHENTLQPLTGTALSARQLVLGLSSGPLAVIGLLVAPQTLLFVAASAVAGNIVAALGAIAVGLAGCALLMMLSQQLGTAIGRRRSPGVVGIGMLAVLSLMLFMGLGIAAELDDETLGLVTVVPQVGAFHLLREALAPAGRLDVAEVLAADMRLVVGCAVFLTLAGITLLAVERRIAGTPGPAVRRSEAFVAAGTLVLAAVLAVPLEAHHLDAYVLATLALVVLPFLLLVMGRVPAGDVPARLRTIPVKACLVEFWSYVALHVAVVLLAVGGPGQLKHFGLVASFHVGWALSVAALVAIRAVSIPVRLAGLVWLTFSLFMAMLAFISGAVFVIDDGADRSFFVLSNLSPVLGAAQAILTVAIPWSLIRAMRKASAGLS